MRQHGKEFFYLLAPFCKRLTWMAQVEEEVTSPNRGARVQETMLPGLEVFAVSFFASVLDFHPLLLQLR